MCRTESIGRSLFSSMKFGSEKQKSAYRAIAVLGIMKDLQAYHPVLCGTIPIGIDLDSSDLDIVMEVNDAEEFERKVTELYGTKDEFRLKRTMVRGRTIIKANFWFQGFEFELFGQAEPVHNQYAFLHMVIEYELMKKQPGLKERVVELKEQGHKTEPAFCRLLGIAGDPYEGLIQYGKEFELI
ncbi:DUF4269 domain-containing protein [Alkalihalobacillus sp. CinArs1]|uniref:DUF4269 domain-containing protein n=1 Tax=Alkalihalobacillus sp. CinArs1 TaxID=2995314 RepID=UPI0022DD11EA|nr:DUF4269 domain-containing protein [Alkalihalobacillus sp. CinArs1]